jgi:hypothetical protein
LALNIKDQTRKNNCGDFSHSKALHDFGAEFALFLGMNFAAIHLQNQNNPCFGEYKQQPVQHFQP